MSGNILAVGDLHLRKSCPAMRTDDFFAALSRKLREIFEIAERHDCAAIVFPGDVFDRSDAPHSLVEWAIREFRRPRGLIYLFVYGQHDLRYHTQDKQNSPLGVLIAGLADRAYSLTPDNPIRLGRDLANIDFYGVSWGEKLPTEFLEGGIPVLVMHRPITMDPLPWDHPDLLMAGDLVKKCPAKLFITGDNHTQFIAKYKHGSVVNLGSVMRTTTAQIEHKPAVALIDFKDSGRIKIERIPLTIRRNVFDMERAEAKAAKEERIAEFISGLQGEFDPELNFLDNLRTAAKDCPPGVRGVLDEVLS